MRDRQAADDDIAEALELFPRARGPDARSRAGNLSGGEQHLLTLAWRLSPRPALLLVDELSLGLAPAVTESVVALLQRLRDVGHADVVVEQSIDRALRIADRTYFLDHGESASRAHRPT